MGDFPVATGRVLSEDGGPWESRAGPEHRDECVTIRCPWPLAAASCPVESGHPDICFSWLPFHTSYAPAFPLGRPEHPQLERVSREGGRAHGAADPALRTGPGWPPCL